MLIWASVIRQLCCKKKKIKVIQLEIWIELTGEITWCLGFTFTKYSNLSRRLGEVRRNEISKSVMLEAEWWLQGSLSTFFTCLEMSVTKGFFKRRERENIELAPRRTWVRPFLNTLLFHRSWDNCPTSKPPWWSQRRGHSISWSIHSGRHKKGPGDHRDASSLPGESLEIPPWQRNVRINTTLFTSLLPHITYPGSKAKTSIQDPPLKI